MPVDNSTPQIEDSTRTKQTFSKIWRNTSIIPTVKAKPPPVPQKPKEMSYKNLPIYTTPHFDYMEYEANKIKCPKASEKLMYNAVKPHVTAYRKYYSKNWTDFWTEVWRMKKVGTSTIYQKTNEFKTYMRHPDNVQTRLLVVGCGTLAGYCGACKKGIPSRLLFTGIGLLSTGALCFPKETDAHFRDFSFTVANIVISAYNLLCGKGFKMKGRLPCPSDAPKAPPKRRNNPCPQSKFMEEYRKKPNSFVIARRW